MPGDVIGQIASAARSGGAARARKADGPEAIHQHAGFSSLVVDGDVAFEKIIAKVAHLGANATESARLPKEENAAKTHRQLHPRLPVFDRRRAGGEYLERSVEEHGVQGILVRT